MNVNIRKLVAAPVALLAALVAISFLACIIARSLFRSVNPSATAPFPDTPVWEFTSTAPIVATPAVLGGTVLIRTSASLDAIDASSGKLIWRFDSPQSSFGALSPMPVSPSLVVLQQAGGLFALDPRDGRHLWTAEGTQRPLDRSDIQSLAHGCGLVFAATNNGNLVALSARDGTPSWAHHMPDTRVHYLLNETHCLLYVGSWMHLIVYAAQSGDELARLDFGRDLGAMAVGDGVVYVASRIPTDTIAAIDSTTMEVIWETPFDAAHGGFRDSLVLDGDTLYAAGASMAALNSDDGRILWHSTLGFDAVSPPTLLRHVLYFRDQGNTIFGVEKSSGAPMGTVTTISNYPFVYSLSDRGPAVSEGLLIVPFGNGRVFAYNPDSD